VSFARATARDATTEDVSGRKIGTMGGEIWRTNPGLGIVHGVSPKHAVGENIAATRAAEGCLRVGFAEQRIELDFAPRVGCPSVARLPAQQSHLEVRRFRSDGKQSPPLGGLHASSPGEGGSLASSASELTNDTAERNGVHQIQQAHRANQLHQTHQTHQNATDGSALLHRLQQMEGVPYTVLDGGPFVQTGTHHNAGGYVTHPPTFGYRPARRGTGGFDTQTYPWFFVERQQTPSEGSDGSGNGGSGSGGGLGSGGASGVKNSSHGAKLVLTKSSAAARDDVDIGESALATRVALGATQFVKVQRMLLRQQAEFEHQLMELHRLTSLVRGDLGYGVTAKSERQSPESETLIGNELAVGAISRESPKSNSHDVFDDKQEQEVSDSKTVSDAPPASVEVRQAAQRAFEVQKQKQQRALAAASSRPWREEGGADYAPADYGESGGGTTTLMGPGGAAAAHSRSQHAAAAMCIAQRQHAVHNCAAPVPVRHKRGAGPHQTSANPNPNANAAASYGAHLDAHEQWTRWYMSGCDTRAVFCGGGFQQHPAARQQGLHQQQGMRQQRGVPVTNLHAKSVAKNLATHVVTHPTATHALFSTTAEEVTQHVHVGDSRFLTQTHNHNHQGRHRHFPVPQHPGAPYAFPAYPGSQSQGPTPCGVNAVGYQQSQAGYRLPAHRYPSMVANRAHGVPNELSLELPRIVSAPAALPNQPTANAKYAKRKRGPDADDAGSDSVATGAADETTAEGATVFSGSVPKKTRSAGRKRGGECEMKQTRPKKDTSALDILVSIANA
jgi:hypothetical protein